MNYPIEGRIHYFSVVYAILSAFFGVDMIHQTCSEFNLARTVVYNRYTGESTSLGSWFNVIESAALSIILIIGLIYFLRKIKVNVYVLNCPICHMSTIFPVSKDTYQCEKCKARLVKRGSVIEAISDKNSE